MSDTETTTEETDLLALVTPTNRHDFVRGYLECLLWADTFGEDPDEHAAGDDLDYDDLPSDIVAAITAECNDFIDGSIEDLIEYSEVRDYDPSEGSVWDYAGHDFHLTRCGHGAGFWDRGLGALGDRLSDASRPYGSDSLEVARDGSIYRLA